jgi:hypothetical protein
VTPGAWRLAGATVCCLGAMWCTPPTPARIEEAVSWLVRPALLPFAWQALELAQRSGDGGEAFGRAQQILRLLPTWTDGHVVFAYRFALDGGAAATGVDRVAAAWQRLQVALAWLEHARADAGRREVELLQAMALLPEVATAQQPGLAELLRPHGGAIAWADRYLAAAERLTDSKAVREQRTFLAPWLCAGLLASGARERAIAVLDTAITRAADVRDRALAVEWSTRLDEVRRALRGEPVDLTAVRADTRFQRLLPHLR